MRQMAEYYRKGVASLQEAATQAEVSLYEMMEYIHAEQIRPPEQSTTAIQEEIRKSRELFKCLKEGQYSDKL